MTGVQTCALPISPYTVDDKGAARCTGLPFTVDVWVEPTPTVYFVPVQDTICDNDVTDIELRSNNHPTNPVRFDYTLTYDADSVGVTNMNAGRTGYVTGGSINERLDNLGTNAQKVTFNVTPYTVDDKGAARCTGVPFTVDVWVEPTPTVYFVPVRDTICDNDVTDIELRSNNHPTNPIRFDYTLTYDADSVGVTNMNAGRTGYVTGGSINERLDNLGTNAQKVTFNVTPYTVDDKGAARCTGVPFTVDVWVEPTILVTGVITKDTICNNISITYTLSSTNVPTVGMRFNVSVVNPYTEITGYTSSRPNLVGPGPLSFTETLNNSGDTARMIMYVITPAAINDKGIQRCPGINDTIRLWINPTPRATPINAVPEMCYGSSVSLTLNSPTVMTKGVIRFDYYSDVTDPGLVGTLPTGIDQPMGQKFTYTYQNNTDTIQSVYYHITPDNLLCGTGPVNTQEVKVHPHPLQSMAPTKMFTCSGGSNGTLTAILAKGSKPDKIFWDRPSFIGDTIHNNISSNIDSLIIRYTGQYSVTVTDNFNCQNTSQTESITGVVFASVLNPDDYPTGFGTQCPGDNNGTMLIMEDPFSSSTALPMEYWLVLNDLDTVSHNTISIKGFPYSVTNLSAGHYSLHLRDANGCLNVFAYPQVDLLEPDTIKVNFDKSVYSGGYNVSCRGYSDGHVWISSITGGNPGGFTHEWYDSGWNLIGTTDRLDNITAGKYYLLTRDVYCTKLDSVELIQGPGMDLASVKLHFTADSAYNISCNGGNDGSIDIQITGGSAPYTFLWTDSASFTANSEDLKDLRAATYTCQVTDQNGCVLKLLPGSVLPSFKLNEPPALDISPVLSNATAGPYNINCNGGTGYINITVTGGSGTGYTYNWTTTGGSGIVPGQANQPSLTAGSYNLEVIDAYGCHAPFDTTMTEPSALSATLKTKRITCELPGMNNGEVDMTVTGGVMPYSYLWSNLVTTEDLTGLTAGTYSVSITDANACPLAKSVTLSNPPDVRVDYALSNHNNNNFNISCFNYTDGSIDVTLTSGVAPFTYSWTGPSGFSSSSSAISGLSAGQYNLHIVDSNLCTIDTIFNLNQPGELSVSFDPSHSLAGGFNINCAGESTGSITVLPVNAVGSVSYLWSDGNASQIRENIPAGDYKVIITDSNNCPARDSITLTQPDSIKLSFTPKQPWCPDKPDGEIGLTVTGGVIGADYNYKWSDNSTSRDLTNIHSGFYSVKVTDLNGCSIRDSINLESQNEICLIIPNAISPNGDLINDEWHIGEKELYPDIEIKIYNRWGILVWKSEKGYPQPWDGRSNGRKLPIDSYHYVINLHNKSKPIIGNITIVR